MPHCAEGDLLIPKDVAELSGRLLQYISLAPELIEIQTQRNCAEPFSHFMVCRRDPEWLPFRGKHKRKSTLFSLISGPMFGAKLNEST